MRDGLVRRAPSAADRPSRRRSRRSTQGLTFGGRAVAWSELPRSVRAQVAIVDESAAVAAVDVGDRRVRHRDGCYWQRWTVWHACREGVALAQLRHELRQLGPERFARTGRVSLDQVEHHRATAAPGRRRGEVPALPGEQSTNEPRSGEPSPVRDRAVEVLRYLPPDVQLDVDQAVPAPIYAHGQLSQAGLAFSGAAIAQEVVAFKLMAGRAVVVTAERELETRWLRHVGGQRARTRAEAELDASPWMVTRLLYELGEPTRPLEHVTAARGELER